MSCAHYSDGLSGLRAATDHIFRECSDVVPRFQSSLRTFAGVCAAAKCLSEAGQRLSEPSVLLQQTLKEHLELATLTLLLLLCLSSLVHLCRTTDSEIVDCYRYDPSSCSL